MKTGLGPSPGVVGVAVMLLGAAVLAGAPASEAYLSVNNMHCAEREGNQNPVTVPSNYPYHDHHSNDYRGNCDGINQAMPGGKYAIGHQLSPPRISGELYLRGSGGNDAQGSVCLTWVSGSIEQAWTCGVRHTRTTTTWKHWPNDHWRTLSSSLIPVANSAKVGFSEQGSPCPCNVVAQKIFTVTKYGGPLSFQASISNPSGGHTDNRYLEMDGFTTWRVHDATGDDVFILGGVPMRLSPGSVVTLTAAGITIEYNTSSEGGNEWTITSEADRVFVWHDGADEWQIHRLDYL